MHITCIQKPKDQLEYKCNTCAPQASLPKKRLREENTSFLEVYHGRTKIARRSSTPDVGDNSQVDIDEEKDSSIIVSKLINQGASTSRGLFKLFQILDFILFRAPQVLKHI